MKRQKGRTCWDAASLSGLFFFFLPGLRGGSEALLIIMSLGLEDLVSIGSERR